MEESEITSYKKSGDMAKQVKKFAQDFVKKGMPLLEIAEGIENKIIELGGEPAFPVNTSINEIAAHYTPLPGDETVATGLLKVDIGVCIDGYISDMALSFDFSEEGGHAEMMKLNKQILDKVKEKMKVDWKVCDVGEVAQEILDKFNADNDKKYSIVTNLCGHTLDKDKIHAGITIPNHKNDSAIPLFEKAFAVEPFITTGLGSVIEGEGGGIYSWVGEGSARDKDVREILSFILKKYKTRPFCARWLEKEGFKKIRFALKNLAQENIIHHYPLLIEKSKMPVSQFENSFLIQDDEVVCLTE